METPVTFQVSGTQVVGILHLAEASTNRPGAVLLMHGFTGTKVEPHRIFVKTARLLAKAGFTALRFDFRGWGDSGGDSEDSSISTMIEDSRAAADFVAKHAGVDNGRIGFLGFSTGGAVAALAAAQDSRVGTLALWNPVADGTPIIQGLMSKQHVDQIGTRGKADHMGNWVSHRFIQEFTSMKPAFALATRPVPTLLIQAANDVSVPSSQIEQYQQALSASQVRCEKLVIPNADHIFSSIPWEQQVMERTVRWFQELLS